MKALQDSTKGRVEEAMKDLRQKANVHAEHREQQEKGEKEHPQIDTSDRPVAVPVTKDANDFEKAVREQTNKLRDLQAETAARRAFAGSLEEEEAASTRAKTAQDLLNAAQHAGVAINDETLEKIAKLADAYSKAAADAAALAKTQQEAAQTANEISSAGEGTFKTFVDDLEHGKKASLALADALAKLGEKLTDLGMNALWKSIVGDGDQNPCSTPWARPSRPEVKPVYAPGSSLPGLKSAADALKAEQMTINAPSVTVNGAGVTTGLGGIGSDAVASKVGVVRGRGGIGSDAVASGSRRVALRRPHRRGGRVQERAAGRRQRDR